MSERTIKSAERTLAVFEIYSHKQRPLTVGEVSRCLDIPQPSASMLLGNLARLGYLSHDRLQRTFSPTLRLVLLGNWINRRFSPVGDFAGRLSDLQTEVGETVFVAMQNASLVQYILVKDCDRPDRLLIKSGQMRPLACSATGRALLSLKSDAEARGWIRRANAEATEPRYRVCENELIDTLRAVRRNGYAETAGDVTCGMGALAVPIMSPVEGTPLAIAVGGPVDRLNSARVEILAALRRTKSRINPSPTSPFECATARGEGARFGHPSLHSVPAREPVLA